MGSTEAETRVGQEGGSAERQYGAPAVRRPFGRFLRRESEHPATRSSELRALHDRGECLSVCHGRSDLGRVDLRARVLLRQVAVDRRHDLRTRLGDLWNRLRVSDSGCDRSQYSLRDRSGRAVSFRIAADGKVGVGTFSPSHQFHVAKNQNANTLLARAGAAEDHRRSHRERRRADGAGARARTATLSAWTPRPLTPRRLPP
jgi:hypothetical protein